MFTVRYELFTSLLLDAQSVKHLIAFNFSVLAAFNISRCCIHNTCNNDIVHPNIGSRDKKERH